MFFEGEDADGGKGWVLGPARMQRGIGPRDTGRARAAQRDPLRARGRDRGASGGRRGSSG